MKFLLPLPVIKIKKPRIIAKFSFQQVSESFKVSNIVTTHKKKDKINKINYRSNSFSPLISTTFEKPVCPNIHIFVNNSFQLNCSVDFARGTQPKHLLRLFNHNKNRYGSIWTDLDRDHSFSMYAKVSEKLTFLTP